MKPLHLTVVIVITGQRGVGYEALASVVNSTDKRRVKLGSAAWMEKEAASAVAGACAQLIAPYAQVLNEEEP